jgi:hypothetical protein
LLQQWKESIILPVYTKGDRSDCSNYRVISLLSTSCTILFNILLLKLSPYAEEIIGDYQCGFRRDRSTLNQILCMLQILEKWEYNETVHQLFIDFKKVCDSVRWEVFYSFLIKFWVPMQLVRLIKMCLNETYSKVR